MAIYKGTQKVVKLYKGSGEIKKVYKGTNVCYNSFPDYLRKVDYLEGDFQGLNINLKNSVSSRQCTLSFTFMVFGNYESYCKFLSVNDRATWDFLSQLNPTLYPNAFVSNLSTTLFEVPANQKCKVEYVKKYGVSVFDYWFLNDVYVSNTLIQNNRTIETITLSKQYGSSNRSFRLYGFEIYERNTKQCLLKLIPCFNTNTNKPCFYNEPTGEVIEVPNDIIYGEL